MATLKFADSHNMVVFLSKPAESEGFEQIVDFLNAHPIKYALTVNLTIYTLYIEQFWSTVKAKMVNGELQLQALVDGKMIIITESTIRRDLQLEDVKGMDCLPNATIFEELTRMGCEKITQKLTFYKAFFSSQRKLLIHTILQCLSAKSTAWNEFSSTMDFAIICLAINQNNEAINEEMDESLVRAATTAASLDAEQDSGNIDKTQSKATPNEPSSPKTSSSGDPRHQDTIGVLLLKLGIDGIMYNITIKSSCFGDYKDHSSYGDYNLKRRVKKLERRNKLRIHKLKRLYKVGLSRRIESSKDKGLGEEDASKHGRIYDIDANEVVYLVNVHRDKDMFRVNDLDGDEVVVEDVDALAALKSMKPKADKVVIQDPEQGTRGTTTSAATLVTPASTRPKAKWLVIHEEVQDTTPTVSSQ
nr:hypothetical protein [Tanacetum cinerariifolium]